MLVDSGAEISATSNEYEKRLEEIKGQIPTLPVTGLNIYNAIGKTTTKASKQMLLPLTLKTITTQTPLK